MKYSEKRRGGVLVFSNRIPLPKSVSRTASTTVPVWR